MKRIATIILAVCTIAFNASAQHLQTAYFLDNYVHSYQLNPASRPDNTKGFFGFGIDNMTLGINSNIGLNSFIFPVNVDGRDRLVTGFNSAVSSDTFLNAIGKSFILNGGLSENLLSFGFAAKDSFITFEANLRGDVSMSLPNELIAILKNGTSEPGMYSVGQINADAAVYAEIAAGYSRRLSDRLSIGGRLKFLSGAGEGSINIDGLRAEITDEIQIDGQGNVRAHIPGLEVTEVKDGDTYLEYEYKFSGKMLGYGAAIDLGAEFKPLDNMTVSVSANDIGGILWKDRLEADANVDTIQTDEIFNFRSTGKNTFVGMGATINGGVRYDVLRLVSVGLLGTVRTGRFGWAEARAGATFTAGKVFSLAASAGVNTFGTCFGAAMSLKVPVVNLHIGFDSIPIRYTPQYIPIGKLQTRINYGLTVAF